MSELYIKAMQGIGEKVALSEIRKVVRGKDTESQKLDKIIGIVHAFEEDSEWAAAEAERREMEADEAEMRKQKADDMAEERQRVNKALEDTMKSLEKLTGRKVGETK